MVQPASNSQDRLPWLTEVPRAPPPAPKARRKVRWEWLLAGLAVVGAGAGSYWLGTRDPEQAAPPGSVSEPLPAEPLPADGAADIPSVSDMTEGDELTVEPVQQEAQQQAPERRQPTAAEEADAAEAAEPGLPTEAGAAPSTSTLPAPLAPGPVQPIIRGRIIQLGAYPSRAQADLAWRTAVKRFPYLASKPRLISPIEVRSSDGKATRMYRLQLATASQAQSVVICQQLDDNQQSCVVVY